MSARLDTEKVTRAMLVARQPKKRPGKKSARHKMHWTREEDAVLRREWGEVGQRVLKKKLRGRSWRAIYRRARNLGLPQGLPQGSVALSSAAEILGLSSPDAVEALARRHGVPIRPHPHPHAPEGTRRHPWRCVDLDDITAAMARETTDTEVVGAAARRRGLYEATLRRWLVDAGEIRGDGNGGRWHRLPSAVIDAVIAAKHPSGYGRRVDVARELGTSETTLRKVLRRAGVRSLHRRGGGVPIAEARRALAEHRAAVAAAHEARLWGRTTSPTATTATASDEGLRHG